MTTKTASISEITEFEKGKGYARATWTVVAVSAGPQDNPAPNRSVQAPNTASRPQHSQSA